MDQSTEAIRELAKEANGRSWELLGKADRTPEDDDELVEAAFASLYCWRQVRSEVNLQRGLWLMAHTFTVLGESTRSIRYAKSCLALTEEHKAELKDFDVAYAYEGISRALALAHQEEAAREYHAAASEAGERISDPEDRQIFMSDFSSGEWYGIA
jgi:hypothetical protein